MYQQQQQQTGSVLPSAAEAGLGHSKGSITLWTASEGAQLVHQHQKHILQQHQQQLLAAHGHCSQGSDSADSEEGDLRLSNVRPRAQRMPVGRSKSSSSRVTRGPPASRQKNSRLWSSVTLGVVGGSHGPAPRGALPMGSIPSEAAR